MIGGKIDVQTVTQRNKIFKVLSISLYTIFFVAVIVSLSKRSYEQAYNNFITYLLVTMYGLLTAIYATTLIYLIRAM